MATPDKFSTITVNVSDTNSAVSSVNLTGYTAFVDIGSGNVLRIYWSTPTATTNKVDYYQLVISGVDTVDSTSYTFVNSNIGNVNEFYLEASKLAKLKSALTKITIKLTACSAYGSTYNSTYETSTYVCKGCGTYVAVSEGYAQPVMKRALAFTQLGYLLLIGADGKALVGADGKALYAKTTPVQNTETGWALMQNFYTKDTANTWRSSDIQYEILTDENGEIITDVNGDAIYTL